MEYLILLGICVVVCVGVPWLMRRRGSIVDDPGLARKANAEAEGLRSGGWGGGS
jgi:hypothetical protein